MNYYIILTLLVVALITIILMLPCGSFKTTSKYKRRWMDEYFDGRMHNID